MTPSPFSLFPDNPFVGQRVTAPDGRIFEWNGSRWVLITSGGGGGGTGGGSQTPWLSNIDADSYSLRNAGQVIVGAGNNYPSLICDPSGITLYDRATISGGATPGSLTISTYDLNLSAAITTARNKPILTTPIETDVDCANFALNRVSEISMGPFSAGAPALYFSPYTWSWGRTTGGAGPPMWNVSVSASDFAITGSTGTGPYQFPIILKFLRQGWMSLGGEPETGVRLNVYGDSKIHGNLDIGDPTSAHMGFYGDGFQWYQDGLAKFGVWLSSDSYKLEIWRSGSPPFDSFSWNQLALSIDRWTGDMDVYGNIHLTENVSGASIDLICEQGGPNAYGYASLVIGNAFVKWRSFVDESGQFRIASGALSTFEGVIMTMHQYTGDVTFNFAVRMNGLPNFYPGAGSKKLWYDPADGYTVKFAE